MEGSYRESLENKTWELENSSRHFFFPRSPFLISTSLSTLVFCSSGCLQGYALSEDRLTTPLPLLNPATQSPASHPVDLIMSLGN